MSANECMEQFSPHLFWDVRKEDIDLDAHAQYVIQRALEYGCWATGISLSHTTDCPKS